MEGINRCHLYYGLDKSANGCRLPTFKTVDKHRREVALPLKTVATQLVEKAGVDVEKLVDPPVRDASDELTTHYYYAVGKRLTAGQ